MLRNVRRSRRLSNGASPKPSSTSSASKKRPSTEDEDGEIDELHADIFGNEFM